jgi:transcriptional regulator with PAS, ATPase and Fis domain
VFLDEIGDVDTAIQVKLLRVLQSRTFQRLGETQPRRFEGKVIAATNHDLAEEIKRGSFRSDFYYRLCSDKIVTPSLRDQLDDSPEDLTNLVLFLAGRVAGDAAEEVADEVLKWIGRNLGPDYDWPGNIRELEQCVRNVMIHHSYTPAGASEDGADDRGALIASIESGALTAEQLLCEYCRLVYAQTGSYEQAAKRLKLDRRTVKSKVHAP